MGWSIAFWVCGLIVGYTYVVYPMLIVAMSRLRRRLVAGDDSSPTVSVVIAARNEASQIGARIENCLAQDYPEHALNVIVVVNASQDDTASIARALGERVQVIESADGGGKARALQLGVTSSDAEVIVFADARQRFELSAVRNLVKHFSSAEVGAVTGSLELEGDGAGIGLYWRYEKIIRAAESDVDSSVGATGAIYAIRRELFVAPPANTILDDVWIPMHVVRSGFRVVVAADAIAFDQVAKDLKHEFHRKVRTLAGNFQLIARAPWIARPFSNRIWWQWFSHKFLRLVVPYALAGTLIGSVMAEGVFYSWMTALQIAFYSLAAAGVLLRNNKRVPGWISFPRTFVELNWAAVVACWVAISGGSEQIWTNGEAAG